MTVNLEKIVPVATTILAPLFAFLISHLFEKESNTLKSLNARAEFLKKIIDLQIGMESVKDNHVRLILEEELSKFIGAIGPMKREDRLRRDRYAAAIAQFNTIPFFQRYLLFFRPLSTIGWIGALASALARIFILYGFMNVNLETAPGENLQIGLLAIIGLILLLVVLFVFHSTYYLCKRIWLRDRMNGNSIGA